MLQNAPRKARLVASPALAATGGGGRAEAGADDPAGRSIAVIDPRPLELDCLVRCLRGCAAAVAGYASVADWQAAPRPASGQRQTVLLNLGPARMSDPAVRADLRQLVQAARPSPVVVISQAEDLDSLVSAVECGAQGFVPPRMRFEDLVEATRTAASGGIFLPRDSLISLRRAAPAAPQPRGRLEAQFTARQLAVARALQRGAANRSIARELDICESTVKVHVRNIMRKLQAKNRTEAACKLNALG
jgi:DNA-binding NarL/FixJ family response regulator